MPLRELLIADVAVVKRRKSLLNSLPSIAMFFLQNKIFENPFSRKRTCDPRIRRAGSEGAMAGRDVILG